MSLTTDLASIDSKITEILLNNQGNYRIGDTSVDAGDFLKTLYDIKEKLEKRMASVPFEYWDTVDTTLDEFGAGLSELVTSAPEP